MDELSTFMDALASSEPIPGGGAASAVVGALGCAQAQMVASLTAENPRYEPVRQHMEAARLRLETARKRFLRLAEADAVGYRRVAEALRMPRATLAQRKERSRALAEALEAACEAPFSILGEVGAALQDVELLSREGSAMAASDVICAVSMLAASAEGAGATVLANISWMSDTHTADALKLHQARVRELVRELADEIVTRVEKGMGA